MTKLSEFYNLQPKFKQYANKEQMQKMNDMEMSLIQDEVLPELRKVTEHILKKVQSPITLVLKFTPGKGVDLSMLNEETSGMVSEPTFQPQVLLAHKLDWSPFEYGFTIDQKFHQQIFDIVGGYIPKGKGVAITIIIDDIPFKAKITNANVKGRANDIIRVMYVGNTNTLGQYLQGKYSEAYTYLKQKKRELGGRRQIELPENLKVMLTLITTPAPLIYEMECKKEKVN